jgi:HlyD family secretion protein
MDKEIPVERRNKERRKRLLRYASVLAALAGVIVTLTKLSDVPLSSKNLQIAVVDKGTISVTLNASGKVIPLDEEIIVAPIRSRILEVYKNAGDQVNVGEPILKLDLAGVETEYRQKLDEREILKSKLMQSQIGMSGALSELRMQEKVKSMQLKQMHTELRNEMYLDSIGASTAEKVRQIELNYQVAVLELEQLATRIENEQSRASAEQLVLQLELSIFEKGLAESERLLEDARILAPRKGTLTYVDNQTGSQVSPGAQIAVVSDLSRFKIAAEIAGSYADRLSAGSKAVVKSGQTKIGGTVTHITPSVQNGIMNFTVLPDDPANKQLRSGLRTDIHVQYGIREEATRIPNGNYYLGPGVYELWVVKGDKAEKQTVELGESSFEYVEVRAGLPPGERVVLSDMHLYKNKKSIKIK